MLVELCVGNYTTFDDFVNEANGIFKHQLHILKKPLYK
jgi:hypothetical protein